MIYRKFVTGTFHLAGWIYGGRLIGACHLGIRDVYLENES